MLTTIHAHQGYWAMQNDKERRRSWNFRSCVWTCGEGIRFRCVWVHLFPKFLFIPNNSVYPSVSSDTSSCRYECIRFPNSSLFPTIRVPKRQQWSFFLQIDNVRACLACLREIGVSVDGVQAEDVRHGNLKAILGVFFSLSRHKQQQKHLTRQSEAMPRYDLCNIIDNLKCKTCCAFCVLYQGFWNFQTRERVKQKWGIPRGPVPYLYHILQCKSVVVHKSAFYLSHLNVFIYRGTLTSFFKSQSPVLSVRN